MPALLTSTSTGPSSASTRRTACCTEESSTTSMVKTETASFSAVAIRPSSGAAAGLRMAAATVWPARAKASAVARPMPRLAPVTRMVLMVDCSVVGDGGDRIINCTRNLEDRILQTLFFPCLWRPNTALDACVSFIEGGARRLSFDSAAEIVLLGRLRRVISGRQPAAIGPVNFAKQPTPAARFAGSPELSRLGGLRPLAAPGREPALEAAPGPADPSA